MSEDKARITIVVEGKHPFVALYINEEGRDLLVKALLALSEDDDHIHLQPAERTFGLPLKLVPYCSGETIVEDAKILFRPDKWDEEYFPHVMLGSADD